MYRANNVLGFLFLFFSFSFHDRNTSSFSSKIKHSILKDRNNTQLPCPTVDEGFAPNFAVASVITANTEGGLSGGGAKGLAGK